MVISVRVQATCAASIAAVAAVVAIAQQTTTEESLARVRLVVTTRAGGVTVSARGATVASYIAAVNSGPASTTVSRTGRVLQVSRNVAGQSAEAQFDVVLADVANAAIVWDLAADTATDTQLSVYALNDPARPTLVDRFTTSDRSAQFTTRASLVGAPALRMTHFGPRLVLAHYYPWYLPDTWRDPQLSDQPLRPYSTEAQSDINSEAVMARAAGIDAWVVSWQGFESGFNDRRMRVALDAAQAAGMRACAYTETYVANPTLDAARPIDPRSLFNWLADLVDLYGSHPAYLRVGGRPVIFTYAATLLPAADWVEVMARLRSSGRNPLIIGDFSRSTLLEAFDGEYQYSNVFSSAGVLTDFVRGESLRVRTFDLLRPGDRRRVWVASVTPGFDDSHLVDRKTPRIVERRNAAVYDEQWSNAIETGADWIVVTSWNEWWENTEVEPGQRYGRLYLDRTRHWSDVFKASSRTREPIRR
jgi:glycosyl hydrolase family 99